MLVSDGCSYWNLPTQRILNFRGLSSEPSLKFCLHPVRAPPAWRLLVAVSVFERQLCNTCSGPFLCNPIWRLGRHRPNIRETGILLLLISVGKVYMYLISPLIHHIFLTTKLVSQSTSEAPVLVYLVYMARIHPGFCLIRSVGHNSSCSFCHCSYTAEVENDSNQSGATGGQGDRFCFAIRPALSASTSSHRSK